MGCANGPGYFSRDHSEMSSCKANDKLAVPRILRVPCGSVPSFGLGVQKMRGANEEGIAAQSRPIQNSRPSEIRVSAVSAEFFGQPRFSCRAIPEQDSSFYRIKVQADRCKLLYLYMACSQSIVSIRDRCSLCGSFS